MSENDPLLSAERQRKSRRMLLLLAAVCIAPFIAAWTLYYFWQPSGRINYGELLENVALPAGKTVLADGKPFDFEQLRGRWFFVTVDSGACDDYCKKKLWQMRQVRLTQGKYLERIERVWLLSDTQAINPAILKDYDGTWMVNAEGSVLPQALPAQGPLRDHIYLVDPLGNVVLRYPKDADPSRMKKDLQRLLRVSRIG